MKKFLIIGTSIFILIITILGVMYSQGSEVIADGDDMYMVSHSEYWSDETGQIIARLYDWQGTPITVTNCTVDIYYPNASLFISNALTDNSLQATTGSHFYQFTTPATVGVYQYMVTCNYPPNKVRSVSSSFHLSPALNYQTVLNSGIVNLSSQELAHFGIVQANFSSVNADLTIVKNDLTIVKSNLTSIKGDTDYIRSNMVTSTIFNSNMTTIIENQATIIAKEDNILTNITALQQYCNDSITSTSTLCQWVLEIKNKVTDINNTIGVYTVILNEINQTTHSTYDYMTGTLATNVNSLLGVTTQINNTVNRIDMTTGQINGTVNRLEFTSTQINNTVNRIDTTIIQINSTVSGMGTNISSILQNQENIVYMDVTS